MLFLNDALRDRLTKIKNDTSKESVNEFIEEYIPFVVSTTSKFLNKYIDVENSEEFSVGLSAFNEAIERFDPERGNFLSYSRLIIESRLKDYLRKQKDVVYLEDRDVEAKSIDFDMKFEIEAFDSELKQYRLSFEKLVNNAPKHKDTRENLLRICSDVVSDSELMTFIHAKKRLPIKRIALKVGQSEKVVKGNKIFILSTVLLMTGEYDSIKSFVGLRGEASE